MVALKFLIASNALVHNACIKCCDDLHRTRPVLSSDCPLQSRLMHFCHTDEASARERCLTIPMIAEAQDAYHCRIAKVYLVPIAEKLDLLQVYWFFFTNTELEYKPVREIDQI